MFEYAPQGVCSRKINFDIIDGKLHNVRFTGGCPGNLIAISKLVEGKDAKEAVHNAVVLEEVARMALFTEQLKPDVKPAPQRIQDKHYFRKHGANAYYGNKL